jgi:phosphoribosyl 1,2-cyclic phosphodiesterase
MKLTFLGTRGYIEARSRRHRRHTSTLVSHRGKRVLIDCGEDWLGITHRPAPDAILVTHAHPDHAFGLRAGAPCPVYATSRSWRAMDRFPVPAERRRLLFPRKPVLIENMRIEAFPVAHSIRAPAVGYRVTAGAVSIFYVPDVVRIFDLRHAFAGIRVYVGDGATISRPILRRDRRTNETVGHASIATQLDWCARHRVPRMIVTHCGSAVVADERRALAKLRTLAEERAVGVEVAYDGMVRVLR